MISIRQTLSELEQFHENNGVALDCYLTALKSMAQYTVELEQPLTDAHRQYLITLATEAADGSPEVLRQSRATLRGLLRDYRDRAAQYMGSLRDQLSSTAQSLQEMVESLSQNDTDHSAKLKDGLARLRESALAPEGAPLRAVIGKVADSIEQSLEEICRQHKLTISQFQAELRLLHHRIDSLETAASIDEATRFSNHRFIAEYLSAPLAEGSSILTLKIKGLAPARAKQGAAVAEELIATFSRRLRNTVPKDTVIGRWSDTDFIAIVCAKPAAPIPAKKIAEHLSMPYVCMANGKVARIPLEVTAEYLTGVGNYTAEELLAKVVAAFA